MIEVQKNYKLTLTEQQAQELYQLLRTEKDSGCLTLDKELVVVYDELKNLFDSGIR
jgi:plasmid replication initiation protein